MGRVAILLLAVLLPTLASAEVSFTYMGMRLGHEVDERAVKALDRMGTLFPFRYICYRNADEALLMRFDYSPEPHPALSPNPLLLRVEWQIGSGVEPNLKCAQSDSIEPVLGEGFDLDQDQALEFLAASGFNLFKVNAVGQVGGKEYMFKRVWREGIKCLERGSSHEDPYSVLADVAHQLVIRVTYHRAAIVKIEKSSGYVGETLKIFDAPGCDGW